MAPGAESFRILAADNALGQTLLAHHDGLAGVELLLSPDTAGDGQLLAELRATPSAPPLATAALPVSTVVEPRFYRLAFAEPLASRQRDYFLALHVQGAGAVRVAVTPGDTYRDGSLYVDARPADGQLVHSLVYASGSRLLGFLGRLAAYTGALLAGLIVCVLPGLGLLATFAPARRPALDWLALSIGTGIALLALLLVWMQWLGLRLGSWNVWLPVGLGVALLAWRARALRLADLRAWRPQLALPNLGLLALVLLVLLVRLAVVGSLEAPMWGDSYQHAMITRLMLDNGGLFSSWQPYAPYATLSVQFGFSAVAAALAWAMGLDAVEATILAGQLLNAAAALTLYPLAVRLAGGRRWAGAGAVLVAGLLSPLPGMYVNWGRYAQLTGQAVLPVAMALTWDLLGGVSDGPVQSRRNLGWLPQAFLLGIVVAGMALCYYRTVFLYAAFVGVLLLCWALPRWGLRWRLWAGGVVRLALAGVATALLFLPWAIHVSSSQLAATVGEAAAVGTPLDYVRSDYAAWSLLPTYMPAPLLLAAVLAVLWALWRRAWMLPGLLLWTLLLAGYMATSLVGVPGAVMLQSFSVLIAIYIPVALACGWLLADIAGEQGNRGREGGEGQRARGPRGPEGREGQRGREGGEGQRGRWRRGVPWALGVICVGLALWGAREQLRIVDPVHILVTRPDLKAMRWIAAETPPDARFLVHGFDVYGGTSVVGADAGWWIPLLAGRANSMPPQYAIANERPEPPDYSARVVALVHALREHPLGTPESAALLCAEEITHIYHGQGQGRVGATAPPLFSPAELSASPLFELRYAEDRVAIFAFDRAVCATASAP